MECLLLICIYTDAKFIVICKPWTLNDGRRRLSSIQKMQKALLLSSLSVKLLIIIIIMEGSYKAHNLQKNSKHTNNKDKQITSVNPEKPDEKDEF